MRTNPHPFARRFSPPCNLSSAARSTPPSVVLAALAALLVGGCESPDPEAALDRFRSAALSDAGDTGGPGGCGEVRPAVDGVFFCALSANLDRQKPLYMELTITQDGDTLTIVGQPLVRDLDEDEETPMDAPRTPVGSVLPTVTSDYGPNGEFTVDWTESNGIDMWPDQETVGGIRVEGEANPLTYRELGGNLLLEGAFVTDDVAFGAFGGEVTSPTFVPLAGSTFACQRTDDPLEIDPIYYNSDILEITPCAEGSAEGSGAGEGSGS